MFDLGSQWGLLTIIGPILLAAAIAWAIFANRKPRLPIEDTEDATRKLYDEQNREDKLRDGA